MEDMMPKVNSFSYLLSLKLINSTERSVKVDKPCVCKKRYITVPAKCGSRSFPFYAVSQVQWLRTQFPSLDIEVDGGVGPDTIHKCAEVRGSSGAAFSVTALGD